MAWSERKNDWAKSKARMNWRTLDFTQTESHPVVYVSWNDAKAFCEWLSKKNGRRFRLPTEAEWEYACRAGTATPFHTGSTISTDMANYDGGDSYGDGPRGICRESTVEVGRFKPNAWGLHDMHGNVCEWCADFSADYPLYTEKDPRGPVSGDMRVARGGGFYDGAGEIRSAFRHAAPPDGRYPGMGFRVVLDAE
jgi:formylglycine-generating enzyme required for sulfatase activity